MASESMNLPQPTPSDGNLRISSLTKANRLEFGIEEMTDGKILVIVESPAKAKTINRYLGNHFIVVASKGHVRDLPPKGMGVDLQTFTPEYVIICERGKEKLVADLRQLAEAASEVYLATDMDREGEAIAWHLKEALGIPDERAKRVIFNAITKSEIERAFQNPHRINMNRVNAQQARRILDRIVGYEVSPLLWRKVAKGLSGGRVQSVVARLIMERDREIDAFSPVEYWKINALFSAGDASLASSLITTWNDFLTNSGGVQRTKVEMADWMGEHGVFAGELIECAGKKFEPSTMEAANAVAEALGFVLKNTSTGNVCDGKHPVRRVTTVSGALGKSPPFTVKRIETKRITSRPHAPLITSTMQRVAASGLGFGVQRTMRAAQSLYEAGYITYMRTDSTHLSSDALDTVREYIVSEFGPKYLPEKPNLYASPNKSAQEGHEAIHPTDVSLTPRDVYTKLGGDEGRLYQLIWDRFVACQMPPAEFEQTAVTIHTTTELGEALFRATGRQLVFHGFMKVTGKCSENQLLPRLSETMPVFPIQILPAQHLTQPPARFNEASLVKELERLGIGRPSTYANIIQTIQERKYVVQRDRSFYSTQLGQLVTDKLIQGFPEMMDVGFTADMETKLDLIEEQEIDWNRFLGDFYRPFHQRVLEALKTWLRAGGAPANYNCTKCGKQMLYRISKNGFFLACGDRSCGATQSLDEVDGLPKTVERSETKCPKCGRDMVKRRGRFGYFLGCIGYNVKNEKGEPSCDMIIGLKRDSSDPELPPSSRT